jgi:catecholate siderophore receptor
LNFHDPDRRQSCAFEGASNKLYYDAFYQSAAPFVLEAPGRSASLVISARF